MIELLLQAERSLDAGLLDDAERIYWQAIERDSRNAIAVVGLARVAIERGDERTGYSFALKALEIDPENATARRLALRMGEVIEYRGEALPEGPADLAAAPGDEGPNVEAEPGTTEADPGADTPAFGSFVVPPPLVVPARRRGLVARLLRRR